MRFCELFVLNAPNLKEIRLRTHYDAKAEGLLLELKSSLTTRNILLDVCYDENFHDREIRHVLYFFLSTGLFAELFHSSVIVTSII